MTSIIERIYSSSGISQLVCMSYCRFPNHPATWELPQRCQPSHILTSVFCPQSESTWGDHSPEFLDIRSWTDPSGLRRPSQQRVSRALLYCVDVAVPGKRQSVRNGFYLLKITSIIERMYLPSTRLVQSIISCACRKWLFQITLQLRVAPVLSAQPYRVSQKFCCTHFQEFLSFFVALLRTENMFLVSWQDQACSAAETNISFVSSHSWRDFEWFLADASQVSKMRVQKNEKWISMST